MLEKQFEDASKRKWKMKSMLYAEICSVLVLYVCVYDGDVSENIEICKNVMDHKNNCISSGKPE